MEFTNVILLNSTMKEAKLHTAAKRASQNPLIGITIQNPAAYHVIKDCAAVTCQYLLFFVFNGYTQPFVELAGKFKRQHIVDFVVSCKTNKTHKQFLDMLLYRIQQETVSASTDLSPRVSSDTSFNNVSDNDPYGNYAFYTEDNIEQTSQAEITNNPVDMLIEAFKVVD